MSICTFFGHRKCHGLDASVLRDAIEEQIHQGADEFLVGHQGQFDQMAYRCLRSLQKEYPHIRYCVVLAYLPTQPNAFYEFSDTFYPEGLENVPPKYAVTWRNRYLIDTADICLCYLRHSWGGAYQFACLAKRRGLTVYNLGSLPF